MRKRTTEQDVEALLLDLNAPADFAGKEDIWNRIGGGEAAVAAPPRRRMRKPMRVAVIAAALMLLVGTFATATAQYLINGRVGIGFVDSFLGGEGEVITDGEHIIWPGQEFYSPEWLAQWQSQKEHFQVDVGTAEAAREVLPFDFKVPTWVPAEYPLRNVMMVTGEKDVYFGSVGFRYADDRTHNLVSELGPVCNLTFGVLYVGPNARIELQSTGAAEDMRFVDIRGCEGIITPGGTLHWIEDGIAYSLSGIWTQFDSYEDAMRMVDSMQ